MKQVTGSKIDYFCYAIYSNHILVVKRQQKTDNTPYQLQKYSWQRIISVSEAIRKNCNEKRKR